MLLVAVAVEVVVVMAAAVVAAVLVALGILRRFVIGRGAAVLETGVLGIACHGEKIF